MVELGGEAGPQEVIKWVQTQMKDQLKSVDYEALPSNPNVPRWCNLVMWERQNMKAEGLLRDDSPRGIWAISETGRQYLQQHDG